jgi:hypothetical protein
MSMHVQRAVVPLTPARPAARIGAEQEAAAGGTGRGDRRAAHSPPALRGEWLRRATTPAGQHDPRTAHEMHRPGRRPGVPAAIATYLTLQDLLGPADLPGPVHLDLYA